MRALGIRERGMPAVLWLLLGGPALCGCGRVALAQAAPVPGVPAGVPVSSGAPSSPGPPPDLAAALGLDTLEDPAEDPALSPGTFPPESGMPVEWGLFAMIAESMFGEAKSESWRPLSLRTFFTEGWREPWVFIPLSSGGAPRQGWINAQDGVFYRLYFFDFSYYNDIQKNGNAYVGDYTIFTPISRRFQFRFDVPFIVANKGGASDTYHGNFGDFVVAPRFLLSETRDFTQVFEFDITTPTGRGENGNGHTTLDPQYQFWYGGIPNGWVIRGGTGVTVPTNNVGARTTYNYNLAFGKYWTPHDAKPLGDLVTYVSINAYTTLDNRAAAYTYLSFTPSFRVQLVDNWFFLAGIEVPVTGPKSENFTWAPIIWLLKVY